MQKLRKIFFDEIEHKYTDEYANVYTSMTTIMHDYIDSFKSKEVARACERIGRGQTVQGINHPKYLKYKGKTAKQLLKEWDKTSTDACAKGNVKHNWLEDIMVTVTGFINSSKKYKGNRKYTIQDIINDHDFGRISIDDFEKSDLKDRYPEIYNIILQLHYQGYSFYAEIAVFDVDRLVSGLVDLLAVHHESKTFIIIDWKTNRNPIVFEAGYFDKDENNRITNNFIQTHKTFSPPIDSIPDSVGHRYSMQLSGYAAMIELYGFKHNGSIICHIGLSDVNDDDSPELVKLVAAVDLKGEANLMFNDFAYNIKKKSQTRLFYD